MEASSCGWADIKVSPEEIHFKVDEGWQFVPPGQYLQLERDGDGMSPRFEISANQDWVLIPTKTGTVPNRFVSVGAQSIGKPAGKHHASLKITSHEGIKVTPSHIPVTLTVVPKEEPEPPPPPPPPEPPPPDPEPDPPPPPPPPDPEPDPDPEPPKDDWCTRFIKWMERIFDWLFDRVGGPWKQ